MSPLARPVRRRVFSVDAGIRPRGGRDYLTLTPSTSDSESPGMARLMLRRACRVTGRRGPMPRASAPPKADAQSSGKTLNTPNRNACSSPGHQSIGDPGRPSGKVRCGRPFARDQLRNSGGNSFSAPQTEQVAVSTATMFARRADCSARRRCSAISKPAQPRRISPASAPPGMGRARDPKFADSPLEGDGFEPVWGFSCQVVILVYSRFFVRSGKAVLRPVACD